MSVQITSVNMLYKEGQIERVHVHFAYRDEERTVNLNGHVPLSIDEYEGNEDIPALKIIVQQHMSQKFCAE